MSSFLVETSADERKRVSEGGECPERATTLLSSLSSRRCLSLHRYTPTMEAKLQALKVPELKKLLQDANLPVSGTKAELIKRLLESPDATSGLVGGGAEEEDLLG